MPPSPPSGLRNHPLRALAAAGAVTAAVIAAGVRPAEAAPASAPAPAGAPPPAAAPAGWVISGARAPTVYALMPPLGAPLPPTAYTVARVDVRYDQVDLCFAGPAAHPCLVLLHPSRRQPGDRRARHFAVRPAPGTDPALISAVVARLDAATTASPWSATAGARPPRGLPVSRALLLGGVVVALLIVWLVARRSRRTGT